MSHLTLTYNPLFPTFNVIGNVGHRRAVEFRTLVAIAFLLNIVIEQSEGILPEGDYGNEVACCEQCHADIHDVPHRLKCCHRTEHHHNPTRKKSKYNQYPSFVAQITHICLTVIVIAYDAAVGKKEDGNSDEYRS